MSDEVDESDGVIYSDEAALWNESRLLQEQEMLWMPAGLARTVVLALFWFAAVRSQCLFRNIGMSENARKRWVLICALGCVSLIFYVGK